MRRVIWWIRRDLRLIDNQALTHAIETSDEIIPVFVLDPKLLVSPFVGEKRLAFLLSGLHKLDENLRQHGSYLVVRRGSPESELTSLQASYGAETIIAEPDYSPYATQRDQKIESVLPIQWVGSPAFYPPGLLLNRSGAPFRVFTPFSKAWKSSPGLVPGTSFISPRLIPTPEGLHTLELPKTPQLDPLIPFPPGENEAQKRLQAFTQFDDIESSSPPLYEYKDLRNRPDIDGTSGLSPYLRFGMISIRQVVSQALKAIQTAPDDSTHQNADTWLTELIWRDFYIHILHHFPRVRRENFRLPTIKWENNKSLYLAWCNGLTGYPIVDAAMRQLVTSGWMHNRCRMIVASFLTKDLLIDWRWGERFFMQHLIDGDPASNNGGWQWTAGTGTDAVPYFRILNPISQSLKHDPNAIYIRRWLPELTYVPDEFIHEPWKMPNDVQKKSACIIGKNYPTPIVDHSKARARALEAYRGSDQ